MQELSAKQAADTATRAGLNTNRLGHHRICLLTPLHMHALLALLVLPCVMPTDAVRELFAEISDGRAVTADVVKDALRPFAQPPARSTRTESAQEVAMIQAIMLKADPPHGATLNPSPSAESGGGGSMVRSATAVPESPAAGKKKGVYWMHCGLP